MKTKITKWPNVYFDKENKMKSNDEQRTQENKILETEASALANDDGFNIDNLRLAQNFSELIGVKKALLTVPVRKPNRQEFVRVRPGDDYCLQTAILEIKEDRISYLVDPSLWSELPGDVVPKIHFTTISRQGVLSLWPVRLPSTDGRQDNWSRSALEAAKMAMTSWLRMAANMSLGAYEVFAASSDYQEPEWPDVSFKEILKIAFRDQYIKDLNHPVVQRLRGAL
jgi:hypothetical protein